jgi:hypothetical protein
MLYCNIQSTLQRNYRVLEALALGENEMPDIKDKILRRRLG